MLRKVAFSYNRTVHTEVRFNSFAAELKNWVLDENHVSDGLFRIRTDGTCLTKMCSDNWCCRRHICIAGDYVYSAGMHSSSTLRRVHIDTVIK